MRGGSRVGPCPVPAECSLVAGPGCCLGSFHDVMGQAVVGGAERACWPRGIRTLPGDLADPAGPAVMQLPDGRKAEVDRGVHVKWLLREGPGQLDAGPARDALVCLVLC